jgi:hypothetical protein
MPCYKISCRGERQKPYRRVAVDEKELKLKAMEVARDITVEFIRKGKFDKPSPTNKFLSEEVGDFLEEMYSIVRKILEEG